jgi:hypothetical protein
VFAIWLTHVEPIVKEEFLDKSSHSRNPKKGVING